MENIHTDFRFGEQVKHKDSSTLSSTSRMYNEMS